ncbi:MAG: hypothetical protein ABFS03_04000 [Chloroflexota bacterium]
MRKYQVIKLMEQYNRSSNESKYKNLRRETDIHGKFRWCYDYADSFGNYRTAWAGDTLKEAAQTFEYEIEMIGYR